jgi:hypothetical protein
MDILEITEEKGSKLTNAESVLKYIKEFAINPNYFTILCIDEFDTLFQKSVSLT